MVTYRNLSDYLSAAPKNDSPEYPSGSPGLPASNPDCKDCMKYSYQDGEWEVKDFVSLART